MKHKNLYILVLLLVGVWTLGFGVNQCISLNGTSNYVRVANIAALNPANVTVEGWVYIGATGLSKRPHLIGKGDASEGAYWLVIETTGKPRFYFTLSTGSWKFVESSDLVTTGVWHHYAGTYDGTAAKVYVDGVLKATNSNPGALKTNNSSAFYIGKSYATAPLNHVLGKIDEVRIWNYARTQSEISDNMDNEISPVPTSLIGYWKFNGNALDSSANNFTTTNNGGTFVDSEVTLPVELSSFTAVLTSDFFVKLHWITQSETEVRGFYIYRSSTNDISTAILVSPFIEATNTSSQHSYEYVDNDLPNIGTYYYWLNVQDLNGEEGYHGPITVYYSNEGGQGTPGIPVISGLQAVYPNPFNPNATISYGLSKAATVDFTIYNTRGQIVSSFSEGQKAAGNWKLSWNGLDSNGKSCASGVYYIKMQAGKDSFMRKAVLMK